MVRSDMTGATTRWLQILIVLLCALALRAVWLQRVAVEHFDEGVYASNVWFDASEGFAWPGRHFYAPPLVPALIEWSILLFGSGSLGTMLPGVLAGTATVALAFHVAGRWFGKEAAWPTAILATLSEFHIIYSRAALTDAVFCFFCLLAVYLGTEAARFAHWRRAIAAGVACGLAWWSKYTGWLPLAIVSTSVAVWFVMHGRAAMRFRSVVCVVLMGLVALLVFSPVLWQLQSVGGYAAVTANHRNYVGGLSLWTGSAQQLFGAHRVLDGWLGYSSAALAALAAIVWQLRLKSFTWNQSDAEFRIAPALVLKLTSGAILLTLLAASGVGSSAVLFCCAMGGVAGRLRWPAVPAESVEGSDQKTIACWALPCWTVAIWLLSLSLVTPMYRPYPRLTLPWLMAVWLGAGAGISWWVRANLRWHGRVGTHRPCLLYTSPSPRD